MVNDRKALLNQQNITGFVPPSSDADTSQIKRAGSVHHNDSLTSSHTLSLSHTDTPLPVAVHLPARWQTAHLGPPISRDSHLGMQLGEEPSISQVANRFIGTGLFSAPLPGKLNRPLLSAMLAAGVPFTSTDTVSKLLPQERAGNKYFPLLIRCSTEPGYRSRVAQRFSCGVCAQLHAAVVRSFHTVHRALTTRNCSSQSPQEVTWPRVVQRLVHLRSSTLGMASK